MNKKIKVDMNIIYLMEEYMLKICENSTFCPFEYDDDISCDTCKALSLYLYGNEFMEENKDVK